MSNLPLVTQNYMNGVYKDTWAKEIEEAVATPSFLREKIQFDAREPLGYVFHQPVLLANETGVAYSGPGALYYNPPSTLYIGDAHINAFQFALTSQIPLDSVLRSGTSKQAVENTTKVTLGSMIQSADIRLEQAILFGNGAPGVAASGIGQGVFSASTATTVTISISTSEWTAANWVGQEGAAVDVFASTVTTPVNTGAQVAPNNSSYVKLVSVNTNARTVTLSVPATGSSGFTFSAFVSSISTGAPNLTLYWGGSFGLEMTGLWSIFSNTGLLFNIDASQYNLWQGNQFSCSGSSMTLAQLQSAVAAAVERGLGREDLLLVINPKTWGNLLTSEAAIARHNVDGSAPKTMANGAQMLEFASQTGTLDVLSHPLMKEGYAMLVPVKRCRRIGTVDLSFQMNGPADSEGSHGVFVALPQGTVFQAVRYTSQQVFCTRPASGVAISGIVNA